jgi:hypothetical protein
MTGISVEIFEFNQATVFSLYKEIWSKSVCPNPFVSPNTLERLAHKKINVHVAFFYQDAEIIGAFPYTLFGGCLKMAGESMSDSIDLLFVPNTALHQKYEAICSLIKKIEPSNIAFKKLCDINLNALIIVKAFNDFKYNYFYVESWKNLFVLYDIEPFDSLVFLKNFNKGNTRNYSNKFKKEQNYTVNVIQKLDAKAIGVWMEFFFMYHELRWAQSKTPSIYASQTERDELESKVRAWMAEGSCILFSLDVDDKPVSMAICLINNKSIIYHQISYKATKDILKYRINKLLIFELSKWMIDNNFEILDFGVGNEPYKYEYTQLEKRIIRLYAAKSFFSKIYLKGFIDYHYQKSPKIQQFLNNHLRIYFTKVKLLVSFAKYKVNSLIELFKSDKKLLIEKIKRKWTTEVQTFYQFRYKQNEIRLSSLITIKVPSCNDVIKFYQEEIELTMQKRFYYLSKMEEGKVIPYAIFDEHSKVLSIAWKKLPNEFETPANQTLNNPIVIIDCFTSKKHRGKGFYHQLIQYIAMQHQGDVLIYTNDWNKASQKGISKAGFEPIAKRIKTKSLVYEWQ